MKARLTNEEFHDRLEALHTGIYTDDTYINASQSMRFYCSNGHSWVARPRNVLWNKTGCPYCSGRLARPAETDIHTTAPWMVDLLADKNDAYKYTKQSGAKIKFICPDCHTVSSHIISNVYRKRGVPCPSCSDGLSYQNRLMCNILNDIGIEYQSEYHISGKRYRYDFYIKSINTIIEMHGRQHYVEWFKSDKSLDDIKKNDMEKYQYAIQSGIREYIVIDSRESQVEYIKNNILRSKLSTLLDMTGVDWDRCGINACRSFVFPVAEMYNDGMSVSYIARSLKMSTNTIVKYLRKATDANLCSYIKSVGFLNEQRPVICLNNFIVYESLSDAARVTNGKLANISKCCLKKRNYAGFDILTGDRLRWMYLDEYNEQYKINGMEEGSL